MWLIAEIGFFSVVQKDPARPDILTIRARDRRHLEQPRRRHLPELDIVDGGGSDYPFRATVQRDRWARAVAAIASSVDYPNFKAMVELRGGLKYADALSRVWSVMLDLQPNRRKRQPVRGDQNRQASMPRPRRPK